MLPPEFSKESLISKTFCNPITGLYDHLSLAVSIMNRFWKDLKQINVSSTM
jgi:hypothetical protein